MNILAACTRPGLAGPEVHLQVELAHYYGCEQRRPRLLHRGDAPPAPADARRSSATSSRPRRRSHDFADKRAGRHRHGAALRQRARPRRRDLASRACSPCPLVPMVLGFDPRLQFVHEDDVVHALEHAALQRGAGHVQRRRRRRPRADGGDRAARQAAAAGAAAVGHRACSRGRCAGSGSASRTRCSTCCASAAASTTAPTRRAGSATATPRARRCSKLGEHLRLQPVMRGVERVLHLRARGRGVPALEPPRARASAPRRLRRGRRRRPRARSASDATTVVAGVRRRRLSTIRARACAGELRCGRERRSG